MNSQPEKKIIADYWDRNINLVKFIRSEEIGSEDFFKETEAVRYHYHYYLPALFDAISRQYANGKLLEVGCGIANDLVQYAKRGFQVTGIDLSKDSIELAIKHFSLLGIKADLRNADAEELPFFDNSFDVVYSFGVLHHTTDTEKAISEVYRVLKPGGMAVIMLYHTHSLNYVAHKLLGIPADGTRADPVPVAKTYTRKSAMKMFTQFAEVKMEVEYLFGTGWGIVNRLLPRPIHSYLGRLWGWHLLIYAKKQPL